MQLIQFILYVYDQHKSRDFYQKTLNQLPVLDVPGMTEFQLSPNVKLGLMPETGIAKILGDKTAHPSAGNGIPRCEIYLVLENAETYIQNAISAGAKLISSFSARDWGHHAAYLSDLDGHILVFATINPIP